MPSLRSHIGVLSCVLLLTSCSQNVEENKEDEASSAQAVEDSGGSGGKEGQVPAVGPLTLRVKAENWKFTPAMIRVKKGQKVTLEVEGVSGTHRFSAPSLGINATAALGTTVTINLPTDFAGTHSFFCSIPCGAGHKEMVGQILIEE